MILTDREIMMALARGSLVIDPRPDERAFASTSVDLTLDPTFSDRRNDARLAARVEGKSSLARLGLGVHVTAPTAHASLPIRD